MPSFTDLIQQGSATAWLFIPSAILLGALHGLEPGHSKTMMAAFIVAIRGTMTQALLLGLAATISHTFVVWMIALGGLYLWRGLNAETVEPYFQLASAAIIVAIAVWMFWRTWREQRPAREGEHDHHHGHDHQHHHGHDHRQHKHIYDPLPSDQSVQDAHEREHARDIQRRFRNRNVTTGQIVLFGLTGGLIPCPAAITVLLICLQLKEIPLGFTLVICFSIGLAITLVAVGMAAAFSVHHATRRVPWFSTLAHRAPYFSSVLIAIVGLYVGYHGWMSLTSSATT